MSRNKRSEAEKQIVRRSGYVQFCVEMRPVFKERHNPNPKAMMSLLGSEWRKLSKAEQQEWNEKAATVVKDSSITEATRKESSNVQPQSMVAENVDIQQVPGSGDLSDLSEVTAEPQESNSIQPKYFCPFCEVHKGSKSSLKDHISEAHIQSEGAKGSRLGNQLNKIHVPVNQERIAKCDVCEKMVNRHELERHMVNNHNVDPIMDNISLNTDNLSDIETEINQLETLDEAAEVLINETADEPVEETPLDDVKVVMVKRKVLWWPAEVIDENEEKHTVMLLNQNRTRITVTKDNIKPFVTDHSQMEGMKRDWRDAYMKAVKLVNKT